MTEEEKVRLGRLSSIVKAGVEPYPAIVDRTHRVSDFLDVFEKAADASFALAGRLRTIRKHGGLTFANLQDESGTLQIAFKKDRLGEEAYVRLGDWIDIGDFLQVTGHAFTTKKGEKTLEVKEYKLIAKSLLPLPEKWHGLQDVETRFRKRYLDLISNPEIKDIFIMRHRIIQFIRSYFTKEGFLEVETPVLQPVASGAIAKPFVTHHNALNTDLFLRIAPELYLKELVVGGFEKVFEIARCFRNEGIDYSHNPEFTQIEFYWAYKDYKFLMGFMEKLLPSLVAEVCGSPSIEYDGTKIDFNAPYERWDFRQSLIDHAGIDLDEHDAKSLAEVAKKKGLKPDPSWGKGKLADELYKAFVRPKMVNPTFLVNHPLELSPLAKKLNDRPNYVERFQLVVAGRFELMNAFSELNDPVDQESRFDFQQELGKKGDDEAMSKDDEFVEALKYGMPPTAGLGMGIDRLVNVLTDTHNIKEVILFPTLRPKED